MSKPIIVGFEGLFGCFGRWLYRGLIQELERKHPGKFDHSMHGWLWPRPPSVEGRKTVISVGHSFGHLEAMKFAAKVREDGANVACVTVDPRMAPPTATKGVPTYNFYQTGRMRGFVVSGASNMELVGSHTGLPGDPLVLAKVEELLGLQ